MVIQDILHISQFLHLRRWFGANVILLPFDQLQPPFSGNKELPDMAISWDFYG